MSVKNAKRYPNIKLGFGAHFEGKPHLRAFFHPWFWRDLRYEIKWAWQRAFRGYDDVSVWGMDDYIRKFLIRGLQDLADNHHGVPQLEEWVDKPLEEQDELWTQRLVEISEHFYESCLWEDSDFEKNEFEEEWHNSHDFEFEDLNDGSGCSRMINVPKNGYTKEQVEVLREKWSERDQSIQKYKREQLELGMKKLTKIFDSLWD